MLCYMDICIAPLADGYSEALSAWLAGEKKVFKLHRDADDIPCSITLRSAEGVSSKVQYQQLQMPGSGIEKYGTKVQEDHNDQQSAADKRSEQIAV